MKSNECFNCLNHSDGKLAENKGWYHPCKLGITNEGLQDCTTCPSYGMNSGFQIGGYYTHMHFEANGSEPNGCLEWIIHGDGEFPKSDPSEFIKFHICDFRQIEEWVKEWGIELRKRGLVVDDNNDNHLTNVEPDTTKIQVAQKDGFSVGGSG